MKKKIIDKLSDILSEAAMDPSLSAITPTTTISPLVVKNIKLKRGGLPPKGFDLVIFLKKTMPDKDVVILSYTGKFMGKTGKGFSFKVTDPMAGSNIVREGKTILISPEDLSGWVVLDMNTKKALGV